MPKRFHDISISLGTKDFIDFIRDQNLDDKTSSRDLPALRQLASSISMEKIFETVKASFAEDPSLEKAASVYLCRKHTGQKLRAIGDPLGVEAAAVSQMCKRFQTRIESDRKRKNKLKKWRKLLGREKLRPDPYF